MKKLLSVLFALSIVTPAFGQSSSKSLTSAVTCTPAAASCLVVDARGAGTVGVQITGTFSGTLQFEQTVDGSTWATWPVLPNGSTTAVTSATAAGLWSGATVAKQVRVRFSSHSSGTAVVSTVGTQAKASSGGGGLTTVTEANLSFSNVTTANATSSLHGLMPKLSGLAYDFALGNGTYGQTVATGSIATSKPWVFTQTWNGADNTVVFDGFNVAIIQTSGKFHPDNSTLFQIFGGVAGTTRYLKLDTSFGLHIGGQIAADTYLSFGNTAQIYTPSRSQMRTPIDGSWRFGRANGAAEVELKAFAATITSGFGTGSTIVGNETAGRVTAGSIPGAGGVVGFGNAWSNAPVCFAQDETTGVMATVSATTDALTIGGLTLVAGQTVTYHCIGF